MYHVCTLWLFVHRHRESNCIDNMIWYWYDRYSMSLQLFLMIKIDAACCIAMLPLLLEQCIDPSIMHLWWSPAGKRKCCPLARMANRCCIRLSRRGYSAELRKEPCGNDMKRMKLGWERWITGASWQNSFPIFVVWKKCNIMKWFAWTCLHPGTLGEIGPYRTWQHHSQGNRAAGIIYSPQRTCRSLPWLPVSVATVKRSQIFWNPWQSPLEDFRNWEHWWHQCCATTKLERYGLRSVKSRWKQILSTEVVVQYADECSWSCNLWNQKKYT